MSGVAKDGVRANACRRLEGAFLPACGLGPVLKPISRSHFVWPVRPVVGLRLGHIYAALLWLGIP